MFGRRNSRNTCVHARGECICGQCTRGSRSFSGPTPQDRVGDSTRANGASEGRRSHEWVGRARQVPATFAGRARVLCARMEACATRRGLTPPPTRGRVTRRRGRLADLARSWSLAKALSLRCVALSQADLSLPQRHRVDPPQALRVAARRTPLGPRAPRGRGVGRPRGTRRVIVPSDTPLPPKWVRRRRLPDTPLPQTSVSR